MARVRRSSRLALSLALLLGAPKVALAAAEPQVGVIPAPLSVARAQDAAPVLVADGETIFVPRGDAAALQTGHELSDLALSTRGLTLKVAVGDAPAANVPAIVLVRQAGLGPEAYALDVERGQARIAATGDAGLFYGAVTLWQLLTPDTRRGPVTLAAVHIEDRPQFAWRGLLLDSARHFQPPAEVERLIDWMSLHKLNVLQWHLVDDQGWRLQIGKYPQLTTVGAWRTPPAGSPDATGGRYGGFYTQDQVRAIVAHAATRHVTIVPEIEMPGHAVSALLAYPHLGAGGPAAVSAQTDWGGFPYVYNVDDRTFRFLEDVLTEVMALFPSRYIHVGGDEAAKERWNSTPEAQARLRALGQSDPAALQADFTRRIAAFLEAHGRRLVGWDEILQGGELPADAVVMSWHGVDGALAAAAKGHDAVLAPAPVLYFDNRPGEGPHEPPGRGPPVTLRDVYSFNPLPATLTPEATGHLLGLQGNLWTEHVRTAPQVQAMIFPKAAAVAEAAWSAPGRRDWEGFVRRLPAQFARYAALGIGADTSAVAVRIDGAPAGADATVTLASQPGLGEMRYTTDGSEPGPASQLYAQGFAVKLPARVRAAVYLEGARLGPIADERLDAASIRRRASQQLRLCNDKLQLSLEGARTADGRSPAYLVNPQDACWIYAGADLTGIERLTVAFARLPFNFGLDAGHNSVILHPPRQPAGELEVRQDSCLSDPIAVAALPSGTVGSRAEVSLPLPVRSGRHDLCFTFTSLSFDPLLAIDWVQLAPPGSPAAGPASHGR
ncbi:family 20 glycosylhydrolase [Phenylobacterium sp.]|uniref:family 20 glycosylhydrolase n=1 Tax=Phenylobacterium sp. TaxID=1871053 RepID=UPI002E335CAA|nr:family 20 glycosylhydrolase [Phenylobacterium sp.]HEX4710754.1 family 20 glycosylhydrolase [Phenylobacterium sp.]